MNAAIRTELLDSMELMGRSLGVLQAAARRTGRTQDMASFEMRLAILKARLSAGNDGAQLLASVRSFIGDFEAFVSLCCR